MDLNYDFNSLDFSLASICAVVVIRQVLEASGNASGDDKPEFFVEKGAMDRISKLNLPHLVREKIKSLVKPVHDGLNFWQNELKRFGVFHPPVFTIQGTVDLTRSTKAILKDEKKRMKLRPKLCEILNIPIHEEMHNLLTVKEMFRLAIRERDCNISVRFLVSLPWKDYFPDENPNGVNAPQLTDSLAFRIALYSGDEMALKLAIDRASPKDIDRGLRRMLWLFFTRSSDDNLSPALYCSLFSKIGLAQQQNHISKFASLVLHGLLKWPYQQFFLEAAPSLANHISMSCYWKILTKIARKGALGYKDCDYPELFVAFWDLGSEHRRGSSIIAHCGERIVFYGLMSKDERSVDLVLGETTAELKKAMLLDVMRNTICSTLVRQKEFGLLEKFLRSCAMNRRELLEQLKEIFEQKCHTGPLNSWCSELNYERWSQEEWRAGLRRFDSIVDKLIAETYCS